MANEPQKYVPSLHYGFLTPLYDVLMPFVGESFFRRELIRCAAIWDGQSVLDVGCGTATQAILLKRQFPACAVAGLDYDFDALALALRKIARASLDVELVQGTAFALPFADGCFDRVVSSLVFHHLTTGHKAQTLREVYRILRPSGEFLLADFGVPRGPIMSFLAAVMRLVEKTSDNVKGLLPVMMTEAGFADVAVVRELPSPFGTVAFYKGRKPG
jgi:ubiquinone/menaquinone biosynthesis C-methylase UbiE